METSVKNRNKFQSRDKDRDRESKNVYSRSLITQKISLPIVAVGGTLQQTLEDAIISTVEGKCIVEGYVKSNSVKIITYSSGVIKGDKILFDIVYQCEVCFPVAGMLVNCLAKNITKAGIRAESADEVPSPFVLFIARDHYYANDYFNSIEENDKFTARVIAQRFELNDKYISIIAEVVSPKEKDLNKSKPRLVL
jgi:DNA-directed RNA polymerase subunit E'/Rpb7